MDILLVKKLLMAVESNPDDIDLKDFTRELMHIFLEIGSETPDNLNCCSHIDYGMDIYYFRTIFLFRYRPGVW